MKHNKAVGRGPDKWAGSAFPPEARRTYDEPNQERLRERQLELREELKGETWEVVGGIRFPYEQFA